MIIGAIGEELEDGLERAGDARQWPAAITGLDTGRIDFEDEGALQAMKRGGRMTKRLLQEPNKDAPSTASIKGGAAIVEALLSIGVDTVFALPGIHIYELFDALALAQDRIRTITPRHEQAAAYMAFGYAKSVGRLGVFAVIPGPGMLNASAAMLTANAATTPILALTGQVPAQFLNQGRGHVHEMPDQGGTFRSFLKGAHRIDHPGQASEAVLAAASEALSNRAGVVVLEMPWDVMSQAATVAAPVPTEQAVLRHVPSTDELALAATADLIAEARRPMIMVSAGALHAGAEVLELAELLGAPVVAHRSGRGIVSEDHPLGMPGYPGYLLWPDTDLLIGIGTRLEMPYMRWSSYLENRPRPGTPKLVRIDVDPAEMTRLRPDVGVLGDAAQTVAELVAALRRSGVGRKQWGDRIAAAKHTARKHMEARLQPQLGFLDVIRELLPPDGIVVEELSQLGFASWAGYPVLRPRSYISAGVQGTLGFGLATALGAKVGNPDRPVVSITGDGGLMFGIQELATAAEYGIAVVTIVVNNGGYANIRRDQTERFGGRAYRADFRNPDFTKLADGFGVGYARADTAASLRPALAAALEANAPALIEIRLGPGDEATPWPFLHPNGFAGK
jgi:acetolactate synthase I/II/III large subunit